MKWKFIVILTCITMLAAYTFVFRPSIVQPFLFSLPYILWSGILLTAILVVLTYLGAKSFPYRENE